MKSGTRLPRWVWVALAPALLAIAGMLPAVARYGVERASRAFAGPASSPLSAPVPLAPRLDGSPIDLSTVMGRARGLADAWQREAALLGIEATVRGGKIATGEGASARLVFGRGPFATEQPRGGAFVVTYDQSGLASAVLVDAAPQRALPEPMCAPEHVLARVPELREQLVVLRYAFDADQRALWQVEARAQPSPARVFDGQDCRLRGNVVPPTRR
jgi:hypothetical protein